MPPRIDIRPAWMADIQALKRIYRRAAIINSEPPHALADQLAWLTTQFTTRATGADAGGFQAGASSFEGGSFSGAWKGSSEEERATALLDAIEEVEAAIDNGFTAPAIGALVPHIITAPR